MTESPKGIGAIGWTDLTVQDAESVRDFYESVVGWSHESVDMGGYLDFCMTEPEGGSTVAGICHARGGNSNLPAQWLIYINVENLQLSLRKCESRGGKVLQGPRSLGEGVGAVIQDPAGAVVALFQAASHGPSDSI